VLTIINGATTRLIPWRNLRHYHQLRFRCHKKQGRNNHRAYSYTGVALTALLKATGGMTNGSALKITAQDGYTKTLSYAQVYQGRLTSMTRR